MNNFADLNFEREAVLKNPYLLCGYGVNAYFDTIKSIGYMMLFITFFISPIIYGNGHSLVGGVQLYFHNGGLKLLLGTYSLGNLGGATVVCK